MSEFDPAQLGYYTGTTVLYRISRSHLLTDGTKYVADAAGAYWLMDAAASHLDEIGVADWFVIIKLEATGAADKVTFSGNELGVAVPFGNVTFSAGYAKGKTKLTGAKLLEYKGNNAEVSYDFSKRTSVFASVVNQKLNVVADATANAKARTTKVGLKHTF